MNINDWRSFLQESKESSEKLLREVTEDELGHIQQALDEMDNEDLAFNKIFDGKMRVILDFKTMDRTSALGTFVDFFKLNGYEVDWNKGMLSGVQELHDTSIANQVAGLGLGTATQKYKPPQKKKIQMKVGKYLKKVADLHAKQQQYFQKIVAYSRKNQIYGATPNTPGQVTGTLEKNALTPEEQENYRRIGAHLDMYDPKVGRGMAKQFAEYWAKNAEYIKDKIDTLENDKYSIVITRHPIDVLRMSDFDSITSCHSPPSRGSGESYYKCAVAEAHGHGAVAYVVHTDQLKEWGGRPDLSLEEIEEEMQTGEIFEDTERYDAGTINPVSRLRLRQVRYYEAAKGSQPKTDDYKKAGRNPFEGIQLAVPEKRVYGQKIPGIRDRVMKWVTEAQQEQMQIVRRDSEPDNEERVIQLDKFIKFGGSYEDNQISGLIADLFGNEGGDGLPANTSGRVIQDTTTEDELDANLVGGLMEQYEEECENTADQWNYRYQAVEVSYDVQDDGGGGVYISVRGGMLIKWDLDDFNSLPNYMTAGYAASELNDVGYGYFDDDSASISRRGDEVHMYIGIETEMIPRTNGMGFAVDPEDFEDYCVGLNEIDDMYDGIKEMLTRFFKREGHMAGSAFYELAVEVVDNGEYDGYEYSAWDVEADDRYDSSEAYTIEATTAIDTHEIMDELPEINPEVLLKIIQSREYQTAVRVALSRAAREELGTEYYVDTSHTAHLDSSNDVIHKVTFSVDQSSYSEQIELFKKILELNDSEDDILSELILPVLLQAINSRMPSSMQQNLDENERIVKSWKSFLRG